MRVLRQYLSLLSTIFFAFIALTGAALHAQDYASIPEPAAPAVFPVEHGRVSLDSGTLHLEIPLEAYGQRGEVNAAATLVYDSNFWEVVNPCPGGTCYVWRPIVYPYEESLLGGWHVRYNGSDSLNYPDYYPNAYTAGASYAVPCQPPPGSVSGPTDYVTLVGGYKYFDSTDTEHEFISPSIGVPTGCTPEDGNTYSNLQATPTYAADGSGYYAVFGASNTTISNRSSTLSDFAYPVDRNGNHLSDATPTSSPQPSQATPLIDSNLQDTLGRQLVNETIGSSFANGSSTEVHYFDVLAPGGKTARYTVTLEQFYVRTNFNQPVPTTNGSNGTATEYTNVLAVVSSIQLPDGTSYQFGYDEGGYGEVTSITLPHGGAVSYSYATDPAGSDPSLPVVYSDHRHVQSHTGSDGTTMFGWKYNKSSSYSELGQSCPSITNFAQTATSKAAYTFSYCNGAILPQIATFGPASSGSVDVTQLYQYDLSHQCPMIGSTQYRACQGAIWRNLIGKTTVLAATKTTPALTSDIQYSYANPASGTPTSMKQWDYYPANPSSLPDSPPGNPTRETDQVLNYCVNNQQFLSSISQKDAGGNVLETTSYTYDEPAYFHPRSSSTSLPNQDDTLVTGNRGNLTTITKCCAIVNGSSTPVVSHIAYDDAGAVLGTQDPNGNTTSFGHDSTDTFTTSTTLPQTGSIAHTSQAGFDASTGALIGQLDQNTQGIGINYDSAGRVSSEVFTNGQSVSTVASMTYPSANETDLNSYQNPGLAGPSSVIVDGYGRTIHSTQGALTVDTVYDGQGRTLSVSNAHAATPSTTDGTTLYSYDELGRVQTVTSPTGAVTTYTYAGNTETVTDPLSHSRLYTKDVFGDLTSVTEPNLQGTLAWQTAYTYDGLGNLKRIDQKGGTSDSSQWRSRTFTYDGVGNLQAQTSPEQGMTTYCYDLAGNLLSYLSAAKGTPAYSSSSPYSVRYTYDADSRLQTKQLANGSTYTYTYDAQDSSSDPYGIGRLTGTTNGNGVQTLFNHDAAGRVSAEAFCMPSDCSFSYRIAAAYDFQDNLLSLNYPDGRQISWNYDLQNRVMGSTYTQWNSDQPNLSFLSNVGYMPTGELSQANYAGFISYAAVFDPNENVSALAYVVNNTAVTQKAYSWDLNAANLRTVSDAAAGRTQSFTYDALDRLATSSDTGTTANACVANLPSVPSSSETYSIDAWGNMQQAGNYNFAQSFNTDNQIQTGSYVYDPAGSGNLITDGLGNSYQYNADGLMAASNGSSYTYDALGQRVRKDGSSALEYFYFGGQLVATRDPNSGAWTDRLYGPGGVFGTVAGTENAIPKFRLTDHLGSLTGIFDPQSGQLAAENSLPFGITNVNATSDAFPFTDHERDAENGSDATLFRHYSPQQGRWLSPDPYAGSLDITDPQSFNRYAYLSNRPLAAIDHYGLCGDDDDDCGGPTDSGTQNDPSDPGSITAEVSPVSIDESTGAASADVFLALGNPSSIALSAQQSPDVALSFISSTLEVIDLIPEAGTIANGANAIIQYARGNKVQASLYAAGAVTSLIGIPGGSAIAKAGEAVSLIRDAQNLRRAGSLLGSAQAQLPEFLYHYASEESAALINESQLGIPGRVLLLTPEAELTPIQAQVELALPQEIRELQHLELPLKILTLRASSVLGV